MSNKKTIYLIRHGETEFNKDGIVQGSGIDSSLNENGIKQAKLFYNSYKHVDFDHVYVSALKRTYESIADFIDIENREYSSLCQLNEICWGDFEGNKPEAKSREVYYETIKSWKKGFYENKMNNGESPQEVQNRLKNALEIIMQNMEHENILLCMHGRAMKIMLCTLLDISLSKMEKFSHSNLCLYRLKMENNKWKIIDHNNTDHLRFGCL